MARSQNHWILIALALVVGCGGPANGGPDGGNTDGDVPGDAGPDMPPSTACGGVSPVNIGELAACDFTLQQAAAGSTTPIDCLLELDGATVELAEGASLTFAGGYIRGGTLVFAGGTIDGRLLNHDLQIAGDATLSDETFVFIPEYWSLVEGDTSFEQALANRSRLNAIIEQVTALGATVFEIDAFDAYFAGDWYGDHPPDSYERNGIKLPSNFHLRMCDDTFLRMYPTNNPMARLLQTYKGENVTITGGHLVGDRYTHDYSPVVDVLGISRDHHGLGSALFVRGGANVTIDSVDISASTADAITVGGSSIRNVDGTPKDGHPPATNVVIRNCHLDASRRNAISIIDADGVLVEGNRISNTGGGEPEGDFAFGPQGVAPQVGIDLEAYRERDADGTLREYERVENVMIRDNDFTGNEKADVIAYTCSFATIEKNRMDNRIGVFASHHITIDDNDLVAGDQGDADAIGIGFGNHIIEATGENLVHDIRVTGNRVSGYKNGMNVGALDVTVTGNQITNCTTGMYIKSMENGSITDNDITSDESVSYGYFSLLGAVTSNVIVQGGTVSVQHHPVFLTDMNEGVSDADQRLIFDGVTFASPRDLLLRDSRNVTIKNSVLSDVIQENCENIILENNTQP